jgi:DNA-binding CsgD family transcriptional regulator
MDEDELFSSPGDRDILVELTNLPIPSEPLLRRLYNLTPAEARLAQALARGDSLEQVAQVLNVKMTTARTQLAAIFSKTRTSRQARLVAILSRLAHLS